MWQEARIIWLLLSWTLVEAEVKLPETLLDKLRQEVKYESILMLHNPAQNCGFSLEISPNILKTPIINLDGNTSFELQKKFQRRFLVLVCTENSMTDVWKSLSANLDGMRSTPTVLIIPCGGNLSTLLKRCFKNKMLNVLAVDNCDAEYIYSYRAFPYFKLIKRRLTEVRRYFEHSLKDMGGYPIKSMPDNILPRSVIYIDADGNPQFTGYIGNFVNTFARSLNASVRINWEQLPLGEHDDMFSNRVIHMVSRGMIDIPMSILHLSGILSNPAMTGSNLMETSKWQLAIPMEPEPDTAMLLIKAAGVINIIYSSLIYVMFAVILQNVRSLELGHYPTANFAWKLVDQLLRASLYQTFKLPSKLSPRTRWIYFMLFIYSFMSYNIYICRLETMMIHPVAVPRIRNYEDLRREGIKILMSPDEQSTMFRAVKRHVLYEYWDVHEIATRPVFQEMRRQPNVSYAYPITHTLWPLIERKFIRQPRPSFRLSKDFIFLSFVPFALPLPRNSIFKEEIDRFIGKAHSSGLYALWFHRTFQNLKEIGKMEELPYKSIDHGNHVLNCRALYYCGIIYVLTMVISIISFVLEVVIYYTK